jgi:2-keto-4-pentenoate hydratase/2-oxohepta-3-ene-1,7-dioic acid hydratase in catechol pathway
MDRTSRPCLVVEDEVFDIGDRHVTSLDVISDGGPGLTDLNDGSGDPVARLDDVDLGPPLAPRNIYCVGWNYAKHFEEGRHEQELPEYPNFFLKGVGSLNGPHDDIPAHQGVTECLDWEAELAAVIGKRGRDIPQESALEHVFGYTVANDVSARDLQRRPGVQWTKGKSLDGTCPMGPWIVTADEIGDPQALELSSSVNGELKQKATTDRMVFGVARLVSLLSEGITLEPGDVILTGTPEGVGMGEDPPRFLLPGDVVECRIQDIGSIRNTIGGGR